MADLRILFCASEVAPLAKTGGLADVVGALPAALRQLGCDARVLMPLYRTVREKAGPLRPVLEAIPIPIGAHDYHIHLWEWVSPEGVPVYLVEKDEFFDRGGLYGTPARGDYEDNAERFIALSRAAHPLCIHLNWFPDIFHLHDWQTGLVAVYDQLYWRYDPNFARSGTVFTIHNLAYQGLFPANAFALTHLPPEVFSFQGLEFYGQCNFMKGGLVYSDLLTTVSPRYSAEIQQAEFGNGLEGILRERRDRLIGILNGIDVRIWDPAADPLIPARFDADTLEGKTVCKETLLSELGFPPEAKGRPLLGMISRLATQKGFDLLAEILDELLELPLTLVILGTGDAAIEAELLEAAERYPDRFRMLSEFNEPLAHRIEAGADLFLMPSRYEPCGLNQMYSLRYGTIPVVHATGGLDDSVVDVLQDPERFTGFKFYSYSAPAFLATVQAALELFDAGDRWEALQRRAMACDFSWGRSAREYIDTYERVLREKRRI